MFALSELAPPFTRTRTDVNSRCEKGVNVRQPRRLIFAKWIFWSLWNYCWSFCQMQTEKKKNISYKCIWLWTAINLIFQWIPLESDRSQLELTWTASTCFLINFTKSIFREFFFFSLWDIFFNSDFIHGKPSISSLIQSRWSSAGHRGVYFTPDVWAYSW